MRVAVVGAGIAGLATAHALRREASKRGTRIEVPIFEAAGRAGGRIRTVVDAGYRIEWAANAIQGLDGAAARITGELGLTDERVTARPDSARRYIYRNGALHLLPTSPLALLGFGGLSARGKLRLLAEPLLARRGDKDESVLQFASRHIGREAARALVGAAVRGIFAGDAARLSLDAAFPSMRRMERRHRSLFFAMARERKSPGGRALWSFRHGIGTLTDALARSAGDSLRLQTPVLSLTPITEGMRVRWALSLASGERVEADRVVVVTPPKAAAALLRPIEPEAARHLATIQSAGLAVVALAFHPDALRKRPDGYGFLTVPGEPLEILGALFESNLFPERAPEGRILIRAMLGGIERPEVLTRSDADLAALALQSIDRTLGVRSGPERTWLIRQPEAIPQYQVGHATLLATVEARLAKLHGLFLTGNGYRGVSVAALIEDAERTVARAMEGT